jgi:Nucleotidyl transferase AbiEii toxin, Type IV TA system
MSAIWEQLNAYADRWGRPLDETVRRHVLEGILRRLAAVPESGFVLRGSMLTRAWVGPGKRMVEDVDLVGVFPHDAAETGRRFRAILGTSGMDDEVGFDLPSLRIQGIWLKSAFPGVRLFVQCGMGCADGGQYPFRVQIDVGFNDPLIPPAYLFDYPLVTQGPPLRLWAVRPETAVGWKLHGLAEMGPQGWRPKDLYDLYLITRAVTLMTADLAVAIEAAFRSRGYELAAAEAVFTTPGWWDLKSARVKWADYQRGSPDLAIPNNLAAVVQEVYEALRPALRMLAGSTG